MSLTTRGRKTVALALGGMALATVSGYVGGASAATTTTYSADCAARLLYLELGGSEVPLYDGTDGCNTDDSIIGEVDGTTLPVSLPVQADLLYQRTTASGAEAGVAHVLLPLAAASGGELPDITVDVLTSEASCNQGEPSGSSHVVRLDVAGYGTFEVPQDLTIPDVIDVGGLVIIKMNQQAKPAPTTTTSTTTANGVTTTKTVTTKSLTQTALEVLAPGIADVVVARTHVDCTKTVTETSDTPPPPPPSGDKDGWMNGGGTMVDSNNGTATTSDDTSVDPGAKVSHGFVLPCHPDQTPPGGRNLTVNGDFGSFKLTKVTDAHCTDDPKQGDPENPAAEFNTMDGAGEGTCNGKAATVTYHFTDEGEPNTADEATLHIRGGCVLDVVGILTNGNNQAHPLPAKGSTKANKR